MTALIPCCISSSTRLSSGLNSNSVRIPTSALCMQHASSLRSRFREFRRDNYRYLRGPTPSLSPSLCHLCRIPETRVRSILDLVMRQCMKERRTGVEHGCHHPKPNRLQIPPSDWHIAPASRGKRGGVRLRYRHRTIAVPNPDAVFFPTSFSHFQKLCLRDTVRTSRKIPIRPGLAFSLPSCPWVTEGIKASLSCRNIFPLHCQAPSRNPAQLPVSPRNLALR
jgi:hypothetical protein